MSIKTKLITHTASHKKAIINLELAESMLSKDLLNQLNTILIELNHIQEKEEPKCPECPQITQK
jgi:hypothetical protein